MITIIPHTHKKQWNELVKTFPTWDIYYLCEYCESLLIHGDGIPYLIYFENSNVRITYPVMMSDISEFKPFREYLPKNTYFDFTTPYGYGGMIYDGNPYSDDIKQFISELSDYAQENNIVSQFIRFHPILKNYENVEQQCNVLHMKNTVYIDTSSPEIICSNFDRKNRNMIRKSIKSGVKIIHDYGERIDEFISIYNQTMERNKADDYYYFKKPYFQKLIDDLKENLIVFYAVYQNQIVGSSIFFYNEKYMHYHLSGALDIGRSLGVTNHLLYDAAKWAVQKGCKTLHLGGGVGITDSLLDFKKQFNKNGLAEFCIGGNIFNNDIYNKLIEIRKEHDDTFDDRKPYFIKYRSS